MDKTARIERGQNAQDILSREGFEPLMDAMVEEQFIQFIGTDAMDKEAREKVYDFVLAIRGMKLTLENWAFDAQQLVEESK